MSGAERRPRSKCRLERDRDKRCRSVRRVDRPLELESNSDRPVAVPRHSTIPSTRIERRKQSSNRQTTTGRNPRTGTIRWNRMRGEWRGSVRSSSGSARESARRVERHRSRVGRLRVDWPQRREWKRRGSEWRATTDLGGGELVCEWSQYERRSRPSVRRRLPRSSDSSLSSLSRRRRAALGAWLCGADSTAIDLSAQPPSGGAPRRLAERAIRANNEWRSWRMALRGAGRRDWEVSSGGDVANARSVSFPSPFLRGRMPVPITILGSLGATDRTRFIAATRIV